jgi:2-dehydro-3-deoxyphosphogluconate aldolase/(4S)-4-hydroxy-2-oxoglutarate aldolase
MESAPVVPVFCHADAQTACRVAEAAYAGGIRVFEFTNRGEGSHSVFAEVAAYVHRYCEGMAIGAGTVIDAPTAALFIQSGADFIVGPLFDAEVSRVCNRRVVPYIPGCCTPTEIGMAHEAGCDVCKLFPATDPAFVKAILAPMPRTKIMATGGIGIDNMSQWFAAGVMCVGMGSCLFPKNAVARGDWDEVSRVCREALAVARRKV